ncbi:MAG: hypothetical protein AAGE88_21345, partial [Actinomycetota bacterium]
AASDRTAADGSTGAGSSATQAGSDGEADAATVQATIDSLAEAYRRADGLWTGFDPNDHPTIIPIRSDGSLQGAVVVSHPDPESLGTAVELDTEGTPFTSLHRIDALDEAADERLGQVDAFEFHAEIGGTDAFVLMADTSDSFLDPAEADWGATFIHELFHRYQDDAFEGSLGAQDVEGYAYTKDNLELAALEERALAAAIGADTDVDREAAARHFAGLRLARFAADDRVELDAAQEMFEGTARYLEHRLSGTDRRYNYHGDNYDRDLLVSLDGLPIKDSFGFGRFYASGSAIIHILDRLGVSDTQARIEAGEDPATVLIDHLGVADGDATDLVAEARATYDPAGELPAAAAEAETTAATEGPVFGDESGAGGEGGEAGGDGQAIELSDEEIACLDEAELDEGQAIPDDVWERCVGA